MASRSLGLDAFMTNGADLSAEEQLAIAFSSVPNAKTLGDMPALLSKALVSLDERNRHTKTVVDKLRATGNGKFAKYSQIFPVKQEVNPHTGNLEYLSSGAYPTPSRGKIGGEPYHDPTGFVRYNFPWVDLSKYSNWAIGYHGTKFENVLSIMDWGLAKPGRNSAAKVEHGQAGSSSKSTIYITKSIEYAAMPVYAICHEVAPNRWLQAVFEVRVLRKKCKAIPATLGDKYWNTKNPFDMNHKSRRDLEWLLEDPHAVVVTGLLVREVGAHASVSVFGPAAAKVRDPTHVSRCRRVAMSEYISRRGGKNQRRTRSLGANVDMDHSIKDSRKSDTNLAALNRRNRLLSR